MPEKLKEVRERMKSVKSTQQITKAMKMVSAAKLRKSQDAIARMRPYADRLRELVSEVSQRIPETSSIPLLYTPAEIKKALIICITSDRGLCGAFNANIVKLAHKHILEKYAGKQTQIWNIGKKGEDAFQKIGYETNDDYIRLAASFSIERLSECAEKISELFIKKEIDAVDIIFSEFKNAALQIPTIESALPFQAPQPKKSKAHASVALSSYIFEQPPTEIMKKIIPLCLRAQLQKAILDSIASEHGARMSAMDKATENANEIFKHLQITYNRARQAAITTEISEIIAGASSL